YISISTYTYTGGLTNSGRYIIDIESFAPSLGGNNLNLLGFSYKVENNPSYTGVGETSKSCTNSSCDSIFNTTFTDFIGGSTIEYTFNAPIRIQDVQNTNKFRGKIDIPEIITTTLAKNTLSTSVTGILLASVIDVIGKEEPFSLSNFSNQFISYQTPNTTSVSQCNGYNKIFNPIYFYTNSLCNRSSSGSSNNIINIGDIGNILSSGTNFSTTWTPKNVGEFIYTNNKVEFRNELSYYVGGNQVFINGLLTNDSLAGFTNGVIETNPSLVSAGGDTINMTVKIIGSSNSTDKISNVLTGSTNELMQLGQISKNGIKDMMRKNASFITNGMTSGSKARGVYYNNGNYSTGGLVGVNTIVVKGGDLTITGDIAGDLKGIIVIKDKDGNGGNIIIDQNVQYIHALIFAEKSIFASGGINAINQLYVKGGIVSDNTIGGANKNPPICPYNVNCDSNDTAKKYDFNYFRYFSYGNGIAEGTVEGTMTGTRLGELSSPIPPIGDSKKYPFVIEHDPAGQSNPPPGFSMKSK
ncbi:hypothetical protein KAZ01_01100, partial [Candidatus Gracilibacteria bacterium]|nr:hypothetical protein [Candidatus Gracilibacteria bacterium]